jgi:hypothetical protein
MNKYVIYWREDPAPTNMKQYFLMLIMLILFYPAKAEKGTPNNPKLCVTLLQQNTHLLHVNYASASVASLDFEIIRNSLEFSIQNDLKIMDVFSLYGKNKNVVMVELSKEITDMYDVTFYKSITIKNDTGALTFIRNCLKSDQERARKIKEITSNGEIVSAYYQILEENSKINRFILFNVNPRNEITLIYIEGELDSDDLITILFTTKNQ